MKARRFMDCDSSFDMGCGIGGEAMSRAQQASRLHCRPE
jgi:hypothetical protein